MIWFQTSCRFLCGEQNGGGSNREQKWGSSQLLCAGHWDMGVGRRDEPPRVWDSRVGSPGRPSSPAGCTGWPIPHAAVSASGSLTILIVGLMRGCKWRLLFLDITQWGRLSVFFYYCCRFPSWIQATLPRNWFSSCHENHLPIANCWPREAWQCCHHL